MRKRKSRKSIERLRDEAIQNDLEKIKNKTHIWVYDKKLRCQKLVKCTQGKK